MEQRTLLSLGPTLFDDLADAAWNASAPLTEAYPIQLLDVSVGPYVEDQGVWLDFDIADGLDLGAEANTEFLHSSAEGLSGQITIPGVWIEAVTLADTGFVRLTIPQSGYTSIIGEPQLPVVRQTLVVPDGAEVTVEATGKPRHLSMIDVGLGHSLAPLQAPVKKEAGALEAAPLNFNQTVYATDASVLDTPIRTVESGYLAGERLVMLEIAPISYNPVQEELIVYDTLTFDVSFTGGVATLPVDASGYDAPLAELSQDRPTLATTKSGRRLLIVTHDDFAGDLADFVAHKSSRGWTVDLVDTSTAGTTSPDIQAHIRARYDNTETRPDAVLLVGDVDRIPAFIGSGTANPTTDLYYGTMDDGDDWYPELPVGRFSVSNSDELSGVIGKTIAYEVSSAGAWTKQVALMAGDDNYHITEGTHDYVIDNYLDPAGYTSDRLYEVTYAATTQDVRDAFDQGRALGIYSGHGSEYSWADGPEFLQSDVNGLANLGEYPIIASFACVTGNYSVPEAFMETWLRAEDGAAVVAVGSSVNSYWTEDDILEKRLFQAIFEEGYVTVGDAWLRAKELYLDHFGPIITTRGYFEMYNVMGDPTVEILGLELAIASPAELPLAFQDEPYEYTLAASSGTLPYTWEVTDGALPDGLTLDQDSGVIGGTPTAVGTGVFTVEVTDATLATASQEFQLPVTTRLQITTPSELSDSYLDVPYSQTLLAEGGSMPYVWLQLGEGQYEESDPGPGYLGGGLAKGWQADDASWILPLPWSFSFYGNYYDFLYVCSNGFLDFASNTPDYSNSTVELQNNVRIAPLWYDLVTNDGDIYVTENADYVAIRWDGKTYADNQPVDFEAVLYRDGQIQFNYGQAHSLLTPTIGVSNGDGANFTLASLDGSATIPADVSSLFAFEGQLPAGLSFDGATGEISGTPTELGTFDVTFAVQDDTLPPQTDVRDFTLEIRDVTPLTVTVADSATEGDGMLAGLGTVSILTPAPAEVIVNLQSDDLSEVTLPLSSVTIPEGETSATFDLQIEDDALLDGTQSATILASALGYYDGSAEAFVDDNETAALSISVPQNATEGDGTLVGQAVVTINAAPADDVAISLISDDPSEVTVPATVTVLAGQTSAAFDVIIQDDAEIDGTQTATITAHVANWTGDNDLIDVHDNDAFLAVLLVAKVWEGQGTLADAGSVSIGGTLPEDLEVSLESNDTGELIVPSTVIIPAGLTAATFDLIVQDDEEFDGSQPVLVSATATGLAGGSGATSVGDNELHHFDIDPIADPQTAGVPFVMTVSAKDVNGETIEVYDGAVDLIGAGDGGPVTVEVNPGKGTAAAHADPGAVFYEPTAKAYSSATLGTYHGYDELTVELTSYAAAYGEISRLVSIGQSVLGRELWAIKITDNPDLEENEPEVKYVSTMHGDEPVGTEMSLYFIDELLGGYGTDPRITDLVDETEIWILPLMNPDGREAGTRYNAGWYDLNRSFPEGSSTPIGNIFDGPPMDFAGCPAEVVSVMQWSAEQSFALSANFHTGALVVNYPYDNDGLGSVDSPTPDDTLFEYLSETYSVHNSPMYNSGTFPNGITNGADWYAISGGMQDWNYRYLGTNEVTIELSNTKWPDESALPGFWADNRESMLSYFEAVDMGARGLVTDAVTGLPVFGSVLVEGNSQGVFTDPDVGDYHRLLLDGTYDLTFSSPGYASRTIEDVVVTEGSATVLDVMLLPQGAGVLLIDGLWTGEVAVYDLDTNVVLDVYDGQGHAGASNAFDVVYGPLDHFDISEISSPQGVDMPFAVTLIAADANGYTVTDFTGTVDLSGKTDSGGKLTVDTGSPTPPPAKGDVPITPVVSGSFVDGVWTGDVMVLEEAEALYLWAEDGGGHFAESNTFDVSVAGPLAEIRGSKFNDLDGDSQWGDGEPGLADWHVYVDLNDNGQWDDGEADAWTDANGDYTIADLPTGTYTVAEEMQPGWKQTYPADYHIDIDFALGEFTETQKEIFQQAADRWAEIIIADLPDAITMAGLVDDLLIFASAPEIDGPGGILGQAGPTWLRFGSLLPVLGIMEFDAADLAVLEAGGQLGEVILHEMAHVIGVGTIWALQELLSGEGGEDPQFLGQRATDEYNAIFGVSEASVPVENTGGTGTRDLHWRESVFGNELMTGWLDAGVNPLSRISAASLDDQGYQIDLDAADPYSPPAAGKDAPGDAWGRILALDLQPTIVPTVKSPAEKLRTHTIELPPGETVTGVNFGNRELAEVVERYVFYNNSHWDDPALGRDDDHAIAPDKTALRPGQTASFANYTSYVRGINAIMVDIADPHVTPTADHFEFMVGNDDDLAEWDVLDVTPAIDVRVGEGDGSSDRVTIVFEDNVVEKQWLQVTVLADDLGLPEDDVFYFGNAIGEVGNLPDDATVDAYDVLRTRNNPHPFFNPAALDNDFDFDRNERVDAIDVLIARNNQTWSLTALNLITPSSSKSQAKSLLTAERQDAATAESVFAGDPLWTRNPDGKSDGQGISPHKLHWLYEFQQATAQQQRGEHRKPVERAVDKLLASVWW